jgi:hypothetical protein
MILFYFCTLLTKIIFMKKNLLITICIAIIMLCTGNLSAQRGENSKTFYTSAGSGTAYTGTVANPFGPAIGNTGNSIQCTEYINGVLYAVTFWGGGGNQFGTLDTETGAFSLIKNNFGSDGVSLSYNPVDGKVYVTPWTGLSYGPFFGTVDIETGDVTSIKTMPEGYDNTYYMAIDNDGVAYAVRNTTNQFGTIDLSTGEFTQTATLPFTFNMIQDMSIDRETNELYWMARRTGADPTYYRVNKETGELTELGTTSYDESPQSFSILNNVIIPLPPCEPVTDVNSEYDADTKEIIVTWSAPAGLTPIKYEIYKDDTKLETEPTTTEYIDDVSDLDPGDYTIEYCVRPVYDSDCDDENLEKECKDVSFTILGFKNYTSSFSIVPNPATNNITITAQSSFNSVEVLSFLGQVVLSQSNIGNSAKLDVSNLTNGIYFVRIGTSVRKFVKQ